ncbi:uncharacterized protein LOC128217387 [Mya arenaria]|uniref:uncharacterized protein LOC128217387 n=1 Tax=Mya arenaria TaxID=6604 RepID=UPI0022E0A35B|nr:uncharacterized protein LOC128217387 [Mya arenaria]
MKVLFAAAVLVCVWFPASCTLLDILNTVHNSPSFQNLTGPEQLVLVEMVAETEAGEIHNYIKTVGFSTVLAIIAKLPADEAHLLNQYLIEELNKEEHHAPVGRRDLAETLTAAKNDPAFQNLTAPQQQLILTTLTHAESMNLTKFVEQTGYGTILTIIDILPEPEMHLFENYLIQHLQHEKAIIDHIVGK